MNVALCFCVRNCERYLPKIFNNIENLKSLNYNFYYIFVYDNCKDKSESLLIDYSRKNKNVILKNIVNKSIMRTVRIANARNTCLDVIYNDLKDISYHIMIDSDNVGAKKWNIDVIDKYLNNFDNDDWDCISFNKNYYYDIWALLFDDFKHHCWGFGNTRMDNCKIVEFLRTKIKEKINNAEENSIEVLSAFNGFCIYKTSKFKDLKYDGLYENFKNLISDGERNKTIEMLKKYNINTKIKTNIRPGIAGYWNGNECCEHLFFHLSAFKKGCKIKISKFVISEY